MNIMKHALVAFAALLLPTSARSQQVEPFKAGDRVAWVGNSITDGGHYHSYVWLYYMTRLPMQPLWMMNCGIGGDTAENILARLDGDVFAKNPNVVTLTFGMNDSGYFEYNGDDAEAFGNRQVAKSRDSFLKIEKRLKGLTDTRIVMIGTSPYDQTSTFNDNVFKNKNDYMRRIIAFQDSAARQNGWEMIDFNEPMLDINAREQAKNTDFTIVGNDRVHPDNDGHMVMAYLFLKAQGMAGKKVADVEINAKGQKVVKSDNCTVTDVKNLRGEVTFDYLADALPYPLDTIAHGWGMKRPQADVVKVVPEFMSEMNDEHLKVTGLRGSYRLCIDDVLIDTLSASELAEGVNLATYRHTPQYQQACAIMALNEERWEIERRFRDYAWLQYDFFMPRGLLEANNEKAAEVFREGEKADGWVRARREIYDKMIHPEVREMYNKQMEMIVRKIYEINKPLLRHVVLSPVK